MAKKDKGQAPKVDVNANGQYATGGFRPKSRGLGARIIDKILDITKDDGRK